MSLPTDLKYTDSHEWVRISDGIATIGITDHAQSELGDVVYVEFPEVGDSIVQTDNFGEIESTKAVSDLKSPISGEVTEINDSLEDDYSPINQDPYNSGWIIKVSVSSLSEIDSLMSAEQYAETIG